MTSPGEPWHTWETSNDRLDGRRDRIPERSKTIQAVTSASMMCPALESRIPALHFLRISVMKSHDRACQGNGERGELAWTA